MNLFQRITTTITGSVSTLVAHVENHDAIVEAALQDTRAASAKARVRLTRIQKDAARLRQKIEQLQAAEVQWEERAVGVAETDAAKAMECVKRRNRCRAEAAQTAGMLERLNEAEREVSASVDRIETRLNELTQQRNILRSRHSAADALRVISRIENQSSSGIDDVFDRWEMRITETEYETGAPAKSDALDFAFAEAENDAALKADLDALLAAKK